MIQLAGRWTAIGRGFGFDSGRLDMIRTDNHGNCAECLSGMLTCWLKKNYDVEVFGKPTWRTVVKVVGSSTAGDNCALALEIAGRHTGSILYCSCN